MNNLLFGLIVSEHVDATDVIGLEVVQTGGRSINVVHQDAVKACTDSRRHSHVVLLVNGAEVSETSVNALDGSGSFLSHQSFLDSTTLLDCRLFASGLFNVGAHALHFLRAGLVFVVQGRNFSLSFGDLMREKIEDIKLLDVSANNFSADSFNPYLEAFFKFTLNFLRTYFNSSQNIKNVRQNNRCLESLSV